VPDPDASAGAGRLGWAALAFGLAALAAAWSPVSASVGLVVGLAAGGLSLGALRGPGRRSLALAALVTSLAASGLAALVLARTAGVGRGEAGPALVPQPSPSEVRAALDAAATTTRSARARAADELDRLAAPAPSN
jgi:hypothetical protein